MGAGREKQRRSNQFPHPQRYSRNAGEGVRLLPELDTKCTPHQFNATNADKGTPRWLPKNLRFPGGVDHSTNVKSNDAVKADR